MLKCFPVNMRLIPAFAIFFLTSLAAPAADTYCPATIEIKEELKTAIPGWTAGNENRPHALAGITFFDGPPAEKASLVFDDEVKGKTTTTAIWKLEANSKRGYWLSCIYDSTGVNVFKRLAPSLTECRVVYRKGESRSGLPLIAAITCK